MFEQKFGFSVVVFCSHAEISLWFLLFFNFWIGFFSSRWFSNQFTAHFRPSFLFELIYHFSLVVFLFTRGILTLIFCFFSYFLSDFFYNSFLNSLKVNFRSIFSVLSMKILWIVCQDLSCYVFLLRRIKKFFALPHFAAFSTFCVISFWLL